MAQLHVQEHIDLIAKHEQDFLAERSRAEKVGDAITSVAGSLGFVVAHILILLAWVTWNSAPRVRHFDPAPFALLGTLVAVEAILLASFILMRQSRISRRSEERDHLMLQVLLLTEKEITAVLKVNREIAQQVGLKTLKNNAEVREMSEMSEHISIEDVAQDIKTSLSPEG